MNRRKWQQLAERWPVDAKAQPDAHRWSAAYYLAGYAVECGLEARILARLAAVPEAIFEAKRFSEKCWTHDINGLVNVLERIGTAALVQRFIAEVLAKGVDGSERKPLQRLCQRFRWEPFASALRSFRAEQKPGNYYTRLDHIVSVCEALCCAPPAVTEERLVACRPLVPELIQLIHRWDKRSTDPWYGRDEPRAGVVAGLARVLATLSATSALDEFLDHLLTDPKHYDLHEVLIPDVQAMARWLPKVPAAQPAFARLLEHCLAALCAATAQPVEPPTDWRREADLGCRCEDCQTLSRFLSDPAQRVGRFPLRKDRRQHLHQQIDRHQLDCTHVTERVGSPQTLVCTKTQASYERRKKQFEVAGRGVARKGGPYRDHRG